MGLKLKVSRNVDNPVEKKGTLYLLEMVVDGKMVVKIGVTCRDRISDRVCEITTSHFNAYRHFNYVKPKRFRVVEDVYGKETILLEYFKRWKYKSEKRFSGCEELVDLPVDVIVPVYEELLKEGVLCEDTKSEGRKSFEENYGEETGRGIDAACGADVAEMGVYESGVDEQIAGEAENKEEN